jgi:catechol 2,3-dioxygenase-like lactoylglutathione lyase family enzyme
MVGLTVDDLDRSIAFYTGTLGFAVVDRQEVEGDELEALTGVFGVRLRVARLRLGEEQIELTEYLVPKGRPAAPNPRSNDRWFQHVAIIVRDMDSAYAILRAHGVRYASTSPQTLPASIPEAAGIRAFYFRDPDGHPLEILWFPPDKGDPKWHRKNTLLFMGIDHTAIVVGTTTASLPFWRDALGLTVRGESWNHGREQAHLNNVRGARLHISALRGGRGPGVEFLEYLEPRDGRPYPADARPNDLLHWQTVVPVNNLDLALMRVLAAGGRRLSDRIARDSLATLGWRRAVLVRDPDGHAVELIEP